jgi:hypothetical protein
MRSKPIQKVLRGEQPKFIGERNDSSVDDPNLLKLPRIKAVTKHDDGQVTILFVGADGPSTYAASCYVYYE